MLAGGVTEMVAVFDDGRVYELLPLAADAEADIAIGRLVAPRGHAFPHLRFAAASGAMRRGEPLARAYDLDLYPDEALSEVARRLGFGGQFDDAVGLTSA
jgi:hypothetical protein